MPMMRFGETYFPPEHIFSVRFVRDTKLSADPNRQLITKVVLTGYNGVQILLEGEACTEFAEWWEIHYEEFPQEMGMIMDDGVEGEV